GTQSRQPLCQCHAHARRIRHSDRQNALLRRRADHRPARLHQHARFGQVSDARGGDRMILGPDLPSWAAIAVACLVLAGAAATLLGSIGLLRFKTFYDRLHPPPLGSSSGTLLIVVASVLCFSVLRSRMSVHEVLIALFMTVTTPVTFILLARAALYRDRIEGSDGVPPVDDPEPQ